MAKIEMFPFIKMRDHVKSLLLQLYGFIMMGNETPSLQKAT